MSPAQRRSALRLTEANQRAVARQATSTGRPIQMTSVDRPSVNSATRAVNEAIETKKPGRMYARSEPIWRHVAVRQMSHDACRAGAMEYVMFQFLLRQSPETIMPAGECWVGNTPPIS